LASLLDMTREEREQYVIQLWKAGRTYLFIILKGKIVARYYSRYE